MNALAFDLPHALEATEPPEERGLARDEVRLLVASRAKDTLRHVVFRDLPESLAPGDLVVVNASATIPAAIAAKTPRGSDVRVHFATKAPRLDDSWRVVELRAADGSRPLRGQVGETLTLSGGASLRLTARYASSARLMLSRFNGPSGVEEHLRHHGEPIRYGYVSRRWPLSAYQNVYATIPGSAEMPSAGRPFTYDLLLRLAARGVQLASLLLHTGVSSPESHEPPFPEYYEIPQRTSALIDRTRAEGGRVIAIGTTVVRALESAVAANGKVRASAGWTNLVIGPSDRLRAVDGLITGWHAPDASHLNLLSAVAGQALLARSYEAALEHGYLWHEFGDSHLILP